MASLLQQSVADIWSIDYVSLAMITAVVYDYILTFSKEVEYIWLKRWTWVSTLFVLARYFGLCYVVFDAFWETSFLPGPAKDDFQGKVFRILLSWSFCIYIWAAELAMILRIHALYGQSRLVLGALLALFILQGIAFIVSRILHEVRYSSGTAVSTVHALEFSFCYMEAHLAPIWTEPLIPSTQIALGTLMWFLTAIRFIKESLQMWRISKCFQLNRYMKHLARDGVVHFIVIALFGSLSATAYDPAGGWSLRMTTRLLFNVPITLVPRFIMSLRELYAHDLQGRRGSHIDTAFGFGSRVGHGGVRSVIVFADLMQREDDGRDDEMQME